MAIEDIKIELEKRFAEPLDEFYKRRIIFWNDEDGEFLDEIESLTLCNAKVLVLEAGHLFLLNSYYQVLIWYLIIGV